MRLALALAFLGVICGVAYYVFSHPGLDRLEQLERELGHLASQNDALAARNDALEEEILALREDPRLVERHARERVGLSRQDELVFVFEAPAEAVRVRVRLQVRRDGMDLAGRPVALAGLNDALQVLRQEMPNARLVVSFGEGVGPIERQRVLDLVEASAMGPAVVENGG